MRTGAIGLELDVGVAALEFGQAFRMEKVREENLLGERQGAIELGANVGKALREGFVEGLDHVEIEHGALGVGVLSGLSDVRHRGRSHGSAGSGRLEQCTAGNRHFFFSSVKRVIFRADGLCTPRHVMSRRLELQAQAHHVMHARLGNVRLMSPSVYV